jgi:hypothetical protein
LKYTTIRISVKDKKRLERLAKLLKCGSLSDALRYALSVAEREVDKAGGDLDQVFKSLKYARDIGETRAEDVDKYLYGGD